MGALLGLLKPLGNALSSYLDNRRQVKLAQIQAKSNEKVALHNELSHSWKDEFIVAVLMAPIVSIVLGHVLAAFGLTAFLAMGAAMAADINGLLNGQYSMILIGVISAVFGIKYNNESRKNKVMRHATGEEKKPLIDLNRK